MKEFGSQKYKKVDLHIHSACSIRQEDIVCKNVKLNSSGELEIKIDNRSIKAMQMLKKSTVFTNKGSICDDWKLDSSCLKYIPNQTEVKNNLDDFLKALIKEKVGIFSITDHNIFSFEQYEHIKSTIEKHSDKEINDLLCLPGLEIDIWGFKNNGQSLEKSIHVLLIFEDYKSISDKQYESLKKFSNKFRLKKEEMIKNNWDIINSRITNCPIEPKHGKLLDPDFKNSKKTKHKQTRWKCSNKDCDFIVGNQNWWNPKFTWESILGLIIESGLRNFICIPHTALDGNKNHSVYASTCAKGNEDWQDMLFIDLYENKDAQSIFHNYIEKILHNNGKNGVTFTDWHYLSDYPKSNKISNLRYLKSPIKSFNSLVFGGFNTLAKCLLEISFCTWFRIPEEFWYVFVAPLPPDRPV